MNTRYIFIFSLVFIPFLIDDVYAQQAIEIAPVTPCIFNYTAGVNMWRNCGADEDYLKFAMQPWEWTTGGNFSMFIAAMFVLFSYIKYHKVMYPILTGIMFLPISYTVFPEVFLTWALIMVGITFGIMIWYIFIKQTKEY